MGSSEGFFVVKNYKTKMNKENIGLQIDRKKEALPTGIVVFGPEDNLSVQTQADWLTSLLCKVYVQHGITRNREKLESDIESGVCRIWFGVKDGQPISSAAVIKQADGSTEIGRAVSLVKGVGSLLRFMAIADHLANSSGPIISEVRVADDFEGIPSGEATQVVCFKHLGLIPQALVPAFGHGAPFRQEMFLFSASARIKKGEPILLPDDRSSLDLLMKTALAVASGSWDEDQVFGVDRVIKQTRKWNLVKSEPFGIMVPANVGNKLEIVLMEAERLAPFCLVPLSMGLGNSVALMDCLNRGFIPCGFDRNLDSNGQPVLLLGKLREGTRLAPIRLVSDLFGARVVGGVTTIDTGFRRQLNSTIY